MSPRTVERVKNHFATSTVLHGTPADESAIKAAEKRLKSRFPADYVEFLRLFGCGVVGPNSVFGIGLAEAMGVGDDVVTVTERFRSQRWPGIAEWVIISDDGRGNPIGIAPSGQIMMSDHDVGDASVLADDFEGFLVSCLS